MFFRRNDQKKIGQFEHPGLRNASKTLLANIRFASMDGVLKTICVTSSVVNEGKSTTASNLACAMATSGKKTLLIDADMRRRSLGAMLGAHSRYGLYSVLNGDVTVGRAIMKTSLPNLYFLDSELNIPNPSDILSTRRFAVLLQKLSGLFDYVVIDTPPAGLFPDASVVAHLTDGTLLVVRQDGAKRVEVVSAMEQLKNAKARVVGTVLTCVNDDDLDHYYSYYHSDEDGSKHRKRKNAPIEDEGLMVVAADMAADDVTDWAIQAGLAELEVVEPSKKKDVRSAVPAPAEDAAEEDDLLDDEFTDADFEGMDKSEDEWDDEPEEAEESALDEGTAAMRRVFGDESSGALEADDGAEKEPEIEADVELKADDELLDAAVTAEEASPVEPVEEEASVEIEPSVSEEGSKPSARGSRRSRHSAPAGDGTSFLERKRAEAAKDGTPGPRRAKRAKQ